MPHTQADETLGKFMDYCTYGHMIDNVVLIVTGTLHERDVQVGAADHRSTEKQLINSCNSGASGQVPPTGNV